jgi:preprotein translocase subunit SecF
MLSGAYSSICIATPVLADLKERQPEYKDLAVKVKRRLAGGRRAADAASTAAPSAVSEASDTTQVRDPQPGQAEADADADTAADNDDDGVTVPPAPARSADAAAGSTRPAPVNRPHRTGGSAQRRPGARKKRR